MTLRESDDPVVPQRPECQSGSEKPSNIGAGKRVGISRDPDRPPPVLSDGPSVLSLLGRSIVWSHGIPWFILRGDVDCDVQRTRHRRLAVLTRASAKPSEIWEPDAVTPHVRICEGPRVNAARLKSCDTTMGNQWPTGNTKLNLNPRDLGLLAAEPGLRVFTNGQSILPAR